MEKPYLLFLVLLSTLPACESRDQPDGEVAEREGAADPEPAPEEETTFTWEQYTNHENNFSLERPASWRVAENDSGQGENIPIINVYSPEAAGKIELPMNIHAPAEVAHVSFFPKGWGTELPSSARESFAEREGEAPVPFPVNPQESYAFLLENGSAWGYLFRPAGDPPGWDQGFVFAQIAIDSFEVRCFDKTTGTRKDMRRCDPMTGDRVEYHGEPEPGARQAVMHILNTIEFAGPDSLPVTEMIEIEQPRPGSEVRSPLTVRGKARGPWFFEGSFPILLQDVNYETVARGNARAQGEWMTEGMVPFTATITFESPDDAQGYLVFRKANPSGLPENARSHRLAVTFPPGPDPE